MVDIISVAVTSSILDLLQFVQPFHDLFLARLLDLPREDEFVDDLVHFVKVEDEVELAHVAEVVVQDLDEEVDRLEERELVVVDVDAELEEQPGVPPVDDLVRAKLGEICKLWISVDDEAVNLELELVLLVVVHRDVVLRRAGLTLAILQEQKPDHPSESLRVHPLVQLMAVPRFRPDDDGLS